MYVLLVLLSLWPLAAPTAADAEPVTAAQLLDSLPQCRQSAHGLYRTDSGRPATVPVCDAGTVVYWTADLDIDCDGRPTARCNPATDPSFQAVTAFRQSDGRPLVADALPYVVVPAAGPRWNYRRHGITGGGAVAVVYGDRIVYGVVGDVGPPDIVGEASYAAAEALGIDPDPATGGVAAGVTYVFFKDSMVDPPESHAEAVAAGEELARRFVGSPAQTATAPDLTAPPASAPSP